MNNQKHELEEKLTLLENNNYPKTLGKIMLKDCKEIFEDYCGWNYEKQRRRYLELKRKYR